MALMAQRSEMTKQAGPQPGYFFKTWGQEGRGSRHPSAET